MSIMYYCIIYVSQLNYRKENALRGAWRPFAGCPSLQRLGKTNIYIYIYMR